MSKIEHLQTFVTVIDENSFAGASKKLGISNAAVSKQISTLEKEIGLQLIQRSTRRLSLTDSGKIYYEFAKKIVNDLSEMDNLVSEIRSEPMGRLKVLSQRFFGEKFIIPHLAEFLKKYPKISLELELGERFPEMEKEHLDLVIGMSITPSQNTIQKTIATTHYVMCASPSYLEKYGIPKRPKDMLQHHYINHSLRRPHNLIRFKDGEEILTPPYLLLNDTRAMLDSAIQGIGIIKLHHYMVKDALEQGLLKEILKEFGEPTQPILISYQPQRFVAPKLRHFIDFVTLKLKLTSNRYFD